MSNSPFDIDGFYAALDGVRQARKVSWKQVAKETGIAASTLTRIGQGKRPDVDGLAALSMWSGLDIDQFFRNASLQQIRKEPLGEITALLRADRNLTPETVVALETMLKSAYEHLRKK
jgi:transcriptional regulator with XRE-family HTH domain